MKLRRYRTFIVCVTALATWLPISGISQVVQIAQVEESSSSGNWFQSIFDSGEYVGEETYVAEGDVHRGNRSVRDITEHNTIMRLILTPTIRSAFCGWDLIGNDSLSICPNILRFRMYCRHRLWCWASTPQFTDSIVARFEFKPGIYGTDHLEWGEFNMPFIAGATYIYSPTLQFVGGVSVDVEREFPVFPAAGVRWSITREWVINGVLPTPRIEFSPTSNATFYAGANIKQVGYRTNDSFGDNHGNANLNNAILTYTEIRTGVGLDWKFIPAMTISIEGGYQPYRSFDFHRANIDFSETGSALYGGISLHGAFSGSGTDPCADVRRPSSGRELISELFRNFRHDQLFAIGGSAGQNNAIRVNNCGGATKRYPIVCAYSIGQDQISLIFHGPGQTEYSQMFDAREWPGRRIHQNIDILLNGEFPGHFGKSQIVTDG